MNVDFEFHLNQMKFIGSRILDVSLHRFASYQRALSYGAEAGKIQDAVLSPNGRFRIGDRKHAYLFWEACPKYEFHPASLPDGEFIINVVYVHDCHAIAIHKDKCGIEDL